MQHSKTRYFIELVIHALFWTGVYYVLHSLTAASFNMVAYNNGKFAQGIKANMLFPYPEIVLAVLMLLFYSNAFWLFKKLIRYKSKIIAVAVIAGWFILLFTINYGVVRMQTAPSRTTRLPSDTVLPDKSPTVALSMDTLAGSASGNILPTHAGIPDSSLHIPPKPPEMTLSIADWWNMQQVMAIIFLAMLGIAVAYFFIKEWIRNDLVRSQAEAQQLSAEVKFLRSQVNPHFLFNTLNNLFSMAQKKGNDELADGISKLSGMMRYMIYESNTDNVPLQKEVGYLQDCIALNKLRYADNEVSVHFSYPGQTEMAGVQVAPMLFVPFLENAFKHGVSIGRNSNIVLSIMIDQKKLTFTCENTDHSAIKKLEVAKAGIGLENIKRRLELLYPGRHTLQVLPEGGKYKVNLKIDLA